jgi:hypothetical protein
MITPQIAQPNATPDTNFNGYNFWLNKLTAFGGITSLPRRLNRS